MTTEISQVGWSVLRVLYQGRMYGDESAARISFGIRGTFWWTLRLALRRMVYVVIYEEDFHCDATVVEVGWVDTTLTNVSLVFSLWHGGLFGYERQRILAIAKYFS
jgi:hypothetical protein